MIDDPRPTQESSPYTFFLPDPRRLEQVGVGDHVKLTFLPTADDGNVPAERMWVRVTAREGSSLSGELDNIPDKLVSVSLGDPVQFSDWNVIDIQFADKERDQSFRFPRKRYFERCLVDQCVLDGSAKVHFVYREQPYMGQPSDRYPDSGWKIRGDWRGLTDEEVEARKACYVALGIVLNKDDSWLHLIEEGTGSRFIRDWMSGNFVREGD
ncbi:DUF2185 domain-containing protein [Parvularcula sp. BGMRC 0090]|uniref:DUF2185 domain-containing protein n=2 Tax=Parvularcula maris TaxID=2965077 RepID=A0A9X2RHG4_9PROT|nr:DUF2185 domain-containing protein [Parvularcula maris]MCQ8183856.1 DUF2185 domain-containing protein [Parvularcula maris]